MQYNKGTRAGVLTRRRSAREETGTLACVTSFGLSDGGGEASKEEEEQKSVCGIELEQVEQTFLRSCWRFGTRGEQ